jgi:Mrp family chromosome partitioning ATPase/capsular polysaccharide biosynthesis protein
MAALSSFEPATPAQDFVAVLRAVRRHTLAATAIIALTLLVTIGVSRLGASDYEATAQILLQQPDQVNAVLNPGTIPSAANAQREVNTNAQLITSVPVADAVRRQLHLSQSVHDLLARMSVSGEATSNLVEITVSDERPDRAAQVATAVAQQYQAYRRESAQKAIQLAIDAAQTRLSVMDGTVRQSSEGQALERRLHQLETGQAVVTGGVQIVRPARVPSGAVPRVSWLTAAVAIMLGLLLAALAVFVLDRLDRRLLDEDAVKDAFGGFDVIARIPARSQSGHHSRERVEAFDRLAARLHFATPERPGYVVLVASMSATPGDDVAIRLAEAMAELEPRVLLIDADLRHEGSAAGAVVADGGLTAVLRGESSFDEEIVLATYDHDDDDWRPRAWALLPPGPGSGRPASLLGGLEMDAVVAEGRARSDSVILAVPSVTSGADALALARLCDEIVLVVRERSVTLEQVATAREVLGSAPAPVLGIVLERRGASRRSLPGPWRHARPAAVRGERAPHQEEAV